MEPDITTYFAPPERAAAEEIDDQREMIVRLALVKSLLDSIPEGIALLNHQRQIVFANRKLTEAVKVISDDPIVGLRPGEAFKCINANRGPGGCGTAEACQTCGAAIAILESEKNGQSERECRITTESGGQDSCLEFNCRSTKLDIGGYQFAVFAVTDISHEHRRRFLERIFFHDLLNTAGSLRGFTEILKAEASGNLVEIASLVSEASEALINEIQDQRQLMAAENNELTPNLFPVKSKEILEELARRFERHEVADGRLIQVDPETPDISFITDGTLLSRVLGNLLKNALEASQPGEQVTLSGKANHDGIEFQVHNPAVMARDVQLQMFQRSFSTKGKGRGLGTYSVKLLTERHLSGKVSFSSQAVVGTSFRVWLPLIQDHNVLMRDQG